jgi:hypothetical protein
MPVHGWTRVDGAVFHEFHTVWIGAIAQPRGVRCILWSEQGTPMSALDTAIANRPSPLMRTVAHLLTETGV